MESRIQHISKQHTRNCNQITSVSGTSLQYKCNVGELSGNGVGDGFPWREKFIEATLLSSSGDDIDPVDNPWHFI